MERIEIIINEEDGQIKGEIMLGIYDVLRDHSDTDVHIHTETKKRKKSIEVPSFLEDYVPKYTASTMTGR